jgi:hypothetical protein
MIDNICDRASFREEEEEDRRQMRPTFREEEEEEDHGEQMRGPSLCLSLCPSLCLSVSLSTRSSTIDAYERAFEKIIIDSKCERAFEKKTSTTHSSCSSSTIQLV